VHLARDAGALFLAHRLAACGELAHLVQRGLQRVGALAHALFQLALGGAQRVGRAAALGDVDKGDHGAAHLAAVDDGVAAVLHREGAAVAAPEHLGVDAAGLAAAKGVEDRAVLDRVVRTIGVRVVGELVHVAAQQLGRFVADHARAGVVDEHAQPVEVDAEHALAGAGQQQAQRVAPGRGGRRHRGADEFVKGQLHGTGASNACAKLVRQIRCSARSWRSTAW
jgi:hypothetical protein